VVVAAISRKPLDGLALLATVAVVALVFVAAPRIAHLRVGTLLVAGLMLLPATALLGPSFALPSAPQAFLFRVLLAAVAYVGVTYLIVRRTAVPFAAKDLALPIALWFGWLFVGLVWAPDRATGLKYIAVVLTMVAAMAAAAAAGGSRRRLRAFSVTMILVYLFILGFTVLEARFGIRLPTSRLLTAVTSQTYAVTSVFHNQNDLATYIAICWPFMLCAFFFTRRSRWLALDLLLMALGAAAFVRTGSRSSLVAAGISTIAAPVLFWHLGRRLGSRLGSRGTKVVGALVAVVLVAAGAYLLFNNSQSSMLRQFRLESLIGQEKAGKGSGDIRASLTSRGLQIAGGTYLLGAGPGQAEGIIGSGTNALGISNLHNWWLETYTDGGIVGFALHLTFFLLLVMALWPVARRDPDPFVRYLASGTVLALVGFTVGALGPSSSVNFAPMWILYGLGLAVVSRARLAAAQRGRDLGAATADAEQPV
jgi:O-Antigen ligase